MGMSELIAEYIMEMLSQNNDTADIQRNEFAQKFGCVPSQINYVLRSRFKPEYGYIVESRRGGGGYIRITKVTSGRQSGLMHVVSSIGDEIDAQSVRVILEHLYAEGIISKKEAFLMSSALSDNAYGDIEQDKRDSVRAAIMKNMLITSYRF